VRQLADHRRRYARLLLGVLQRVALDAGLVLLEIEGRALDESRVVEPGVDDLAADGVGQGDVGADVDAQPAVGPLRRIRPARVDRVELGAVVERFQDMQEVDRMRLARIRSPEDNEIGLLSLAI
jgi:hypothetical protein